MSDTILEVENLRVSYPVSMRAGFRKQIAQIRAVDGVSFVVGKGESLALVGESGCGKSSLARAILGLVPSDGRIALSGSDLNSQSRRPQSSRRMIQMVFQDPYDSLNRRMSVEEIVAEPLDIHSLAQGQARKSRIADLLNQVRLPSAVASRYPKQLSGGQRQRVAIARALAVDPSILVLDEPLSALDVSVQAQILTLLKELQRERDVSYLFITHDLSVIRYLCDRVAVMYLGRILEDGPTRRVIREPRHPYTRALISAVPVPDPQVEGRRKRILLEGDVPSPINPPPGCRFYPRCPFKGDPRCAYEEPELKEIGNHHWVACFYDVESLAGGSELTA